MRVVVALGRRALLPRTVGGDRVRRTHVHAAARALLPVALEHELVVCHAAVRPDLADLDPAATVDDTTAMWQGLVGYWLVQELVNAGVPAPVVGVCAQSVVSGADPTDVGQPERIVEFDAIRQLADRGMLVVCGGGVAVLTDGIRLLPVDEVIDVDATAALLAVGLDADRLLLLTDVDGVRSDGDPGADRAVRSATVREMRNLRVRPAHLAPEVAAGIRFVTGTGRPAVIGAVEDADDLVLGRRGTSIYPDTSAPDYGPRR